MILGILQARTSSTRLPKKVLMPLLGQPMLARQCERLRRVRHIDRLMIATSDESSDDPLEALAGELGLLCYRGSLGDVLDRFYRAAEPLAPEHVVRLTGDCPLTDPELIDHVIEVHLAEANDYTANGIERTYPNGLDVEVLRMGVLAQAWREARLPSQREHVTSFIYEQPERFKLGYVKNDRDLSAFRWTVDEPEDFELVRRIYEQLYPETPDFSTADILALLDAEPEWSTLNAHFEADEGLRKSRDADAQFLEEHDRDA